MSDLNNVTIVGRLTKDPEVKTTSNGKLYTDIRIANNRTYHNGNNEKIEEKNFFTVTLWGRQGEVAGEFLKKGKRVGIEGRLNQFQFNTPSGDKINVIRIVAKQFQFLDGSRKMNDSKNQEALKIENSNPEDKEISMPI